MILPYAPTDSVAPYGAIQRAAAIEQLREHYAAQERDASTADCPRCGKPCQRRPHHSAHCSACMQSFRTDTTEDHR